MRDMKGRRLRLYEFDLSESFKWHIVRVQIFARTRRIAKKWAKKEFPAEAGWGIRERRKK